MKATLGIMELIRRCGGDEAVIFQNLMTDMRGAQQLKDGATEIRFGTRVITATDVALGTPEKLGLVIWLDQAKVTAALADFKREQAEPSAVTR